MKISTELSPLVGITSRVRMSHSLERMGNSKGNLTHKDPLVIFDPITFKVMRPNTYY